MTEQRSNAKDAVTEESLITDPRARGCIERMHKDVEQGVSNAIVAEFVRAVAGDVSAFARRVHGLSEFLGGMEGMAKDEQEWLFALMDAFVSKPSAVTNEDEQYQLCRLVVVRVTHAVTAAWFSALRCAITESNGMAWLRLDVLDDAMLPRNNAEAMEAFEERLAEVGIGSVSVDEARGMLKSARLSLPSRAVLPASVIEYLSLIDVTVVR